MAERLWPLSNRRQIEDIVADRNATRVQHALQIVEETAGGEEAASAFRSVLDVKWRRWRVEAAFFILANYGRSRIRLKEILEYREQIERAGLALIAITDGLDQAAHAIGPIGDAPELHEYSQVGGNAIEDLAALLERVKRLEGALLASFGQDRGGRDLVTRSRGDDVERWATLVARQWVMREGAPARPLVGPDGAAFLTVLSALFEAFDGRDPDTIKPHPISEKLVRRVRDRLGQEDAQAIQDEADFEAARERFREEPADEDRSDGDPLPPSKFRG